jgi:hypothetical protein
MELMIRQSYTAVVERNRVWSDHYETEPYEAAWASEAIFFIRTLEATHLEAGVQARVQISPDGLHWCDEGTTIALPAEPETVTFGRVNQFGGWLRLAGEVPAGGSIKVIVYLALKE